MAAGPALQTAEMRLLGGAGSSFTYCAHLQVVTGADPGSQICSSCRIEDMGMAPRHSLWHGKRHFFVPQSFMRCEGSRRGALTWNGGL